MRNAARALTLALLLPALSGAQAPPKPAPNQPVTAAYYYRVKWGFQDEFERLFLKNHYPVLKAEMASTGPIQSVLLYKPMFHGDGRADWTYLVVITYKSWAAMNQPREEGLLKRLYPDPLAYAERFEHRLEQLIEEGWLLPEDADEMRRDAVVAEVE